MGLLDLFRAQGDDVTAPRQRKTSKPPQSPAAAGRRPKHTMQSNPDRMDDIVLPTPKPRKVEQWTPLAIVLYSDSWRCTCGNCGKDAPLWMLRETHGAGRFKQTRVRNIGNPNAYPQLPVEVDEVEPRIMRTCPACTISAIRHPQLQLDLALPAIVAPAYTTPPLEELFNRYEAMRIAANSIRALL